MALVCVLIPPATQWHLARRRMGLDCLPPIPVLVGLRLVLPMKFALPGQTTVVCGVAGCMRECHHGCVEACAEMGNLFPVVCIHQPWMGYNHQIPCLCFISAQCGAMRPHRQVETDLLTCLPSSNPVIPEQHCCMSSHSNPPPPPHAHTQWQLVGRWFGLSAA